MRRTMLLALAVFVLLGTGCAVTYPEGVFACTMPDDCPAGWSCRDSRCYSTAGPDAGLDSGLDAGAPEDANIDAPIVDAGPPDAPRVDLGCPATGPTNADCPWYFGRPHAVPSLQPGTSVFSAALLGNGLSLYVAGYGGPPYAPVYEASRADPSVPFGPLRPTLGAQTPGVELGLVSITADGLEMFAQTSDARSGAAREHILRYSRTSTVSTFGLPEAIPAVDALDDTKHPSITADGLELFFVNVDSSAVRTLYSTRRPARDQPFEMARAAGLPRGFDYFRVTPDGLGIFGGTPAWYATRADRRSVFGAPAPLPNAGPLADFAFPTYVPETRELWYATGLGGATVPWSATQYALWRVQVCRDEPCAPEPTPACPASSVASADGFQCYFAQPSLASIGAARDACLATSGGSFHLATVHSAAELAVVLSVGGGWLGAERATAADPFRWDTGEPFIFSAWPVGGPDMVAANRYLAAVPGTTGSAEFLAVPNTSRTSVCEQSIWPTW